MTRATQDPNDPIWRVQFRMREVRLLARVSQREMARRIGSHRPIISRIELGEHAPNLDTILRFAKALGVQPSAILSALDEQPEAACAAE
jgi:transcriptional regulator with XRE-family HTH domain